MIWPWDMYEKIALRISYGNGNPLSRRRHDGLGESVSKDGAVVDRQELMPEAWSLRT